MEGARAPGAATPGRSQSRGRVLMGLMFFPRGGSAQVTRSLARALPAHDWEVKVASGSLADAAGHSDATRFFAGLDLHAVDYSDAVVAADPLAHDPPMHPSYEDRPGAVDPVFASVDEAGFEHLVAAWSRELTRAGAGEADVLHLHHLTPLHEAAQRLWPEVPRLGHVHGTELLMLEEIAEGPPAGWAHAREWAERMREWAHGCRRLVLLSDAQVERVQRLLGVAADRCTVVPNGFDPEAFDRREVDRRAHWRRHLVAEPQGWAPGGEAGSVGYAEGDLAAFEHGPVLLYVGRFTAVKRIGLLIRAHARASQRYATRAPLVLLGGFPGEWEGEHPLETVWACGAPDVFLAGWHGHAALPDFLNACDVVVLPSVREQFGQVLVEGMACGLPAIAIDAHGPARIVEDGRTGWLVEADDEEQLAGALVEAVNDAAERRRRGEAARREARARYSWPALAGQVAELYDAVRR